MGNEFNPLHFGKRQLLTLPIQCAFFPCRLKVKLVVQDATHEPDDSAIHIIIGSK